MVKNLISIIVPVYKVEKELGECIESLMHQTYKNIEIILVDDGSPDKCPEICEHYANIDSRIRVIHKENGGLSDARNYGITEANGEFLGFVDSDDFVDEIMYEKLFEAAQSTSSDIAECDCVRFADGERPNLIIKEGQKIIKPKEWITETNLNGFLNCVAWNKLYRRELFEGVRYPVGRNNEDEATTYKLVYKANKIVRIESSLYFYRQRTGSITNSKITSKIINDKYTALKEKTLYFDQNGEKSIADFCRARLAISMISFYDWQKNNGNGKKWYLEIRSLFKKTFFSKAVPYKYKVYIGGFVLCPVLYKYISK